MAARDVTKMRMVMLGGSFSEHKNLLSAQNIAQLCELLHKHQTCGKWKNVKSEYKTPLNWCSTLSPPEYLVCTTKDI